MVVVGAGYGGAPPGALLAHQGRRVALIEKTSRAGGKTQTLGRRGYRDEMFGAVGIPGVGSRFDELVDMLGIHDQVRLLVPEGHVAAIRFRAPDGTWRAQSSPRRRLRAGDRPGLLLLNTVGPFGRDREPLSGMSEENRSATSTGLDPDPTGRPIHLAGQGASGMNDFWSSHAAARAARRHQVPTALPLCRQRCHHAFMSDASTFRLSEVPVHLGLGTTVVLQETFTGTPDWYERYGERHAADGAGGRLVSMHTFNEPWNSWEMHPHGRELVICTNGTFTLHQEVDDDSVQVTLTAGDAIVNPPGVWHTADAAGSVTVLFITAGLGTEVRPR